MGVADLLCTHLLNIDPLDASVSNPSGVGTNDWDVAPSEGSSADSASDEEDDDFVAPQPILAPRGLSGVLRRLASRGAPQAGDEYSVDNALDTSRFKGNTVLLNVYDVSDSEQIQKINRIFTAQNKVLVGGVFHAGVEVYGHEWGYGGTEDDRTGVGAVLPRSHPHHKYRCTVAMGDTSLSQEEVRDLVCRLAKEWPGLEYHLLHHNCLNFCNALLKELGLRHIPGWVDRASRVGSRLDQAAQMVRAIRERGDAKEQAAIAFKALNQKAQEQFKTFGTTVCTTWLPMASAAVLPLGAGLINRAFQVQAKLGNRGDCPRERSKDKLRVQFEPGAIGVAMTGRGKITHVGQKGQAEAKGVKLGWTILTINGEPFSEERLDSMILGAEAYNVVFRRGSKLGAKKPNLKKRGIHTNVKENMVTEAEPEKLVQEEQVAEQLAIPCPAEEFHVDVDEDDDEEDGRRFKCPTDSDDSIEREASSAAEIAERQACSAAEIPAC